MPGRIAPPAFVIAAAPGINAQFAADLRDRLRQILPGHVWQIEVVAGIGKPSLDDEQRAAEAAAREAILATPVVAAIRSAFPDAELIEEPRSVMQ